MLSNMSKKKYEILITIIIRDKSLMARTLPLLFKTYIFKNITHLNVLNRFDRFSSLWILTCKFEVANAYPTESKYISLHVAIAIIYTQRVSIEDSNYRLASYGPLSAQSGANFCT